MHYLSNIIYYSLEVLHPLVIFIYIYIYILPQRFHMLDDPQDSSHQLYIILLLNIHP